MKKNNLLYVLGLLIILLVVVLYLRKNTPESIKIYGETMGTTYHIIYFDVRQRNLKPQIDSLLIDFNKSLSTYLPDSEISRYNRSKSLRYKLPYLLPMLKKSKKITYASKGTFDPTVMPLVNAWGFGPGKKTRLNSVQIDSIRKIVGFGKVLFNTDSVWKTDPRVQLDFSAIAKGYGVDVVTDFITSRGIENVFVEIGGEVRAEGKNLQLDKMWEVGILAPDSTSSRLSYIAYATLHNNAVATSGNYFNYYEQDGKKYAHTIDPKSGNPIQRDILSASVFAEDCTTADAWATAFMVMGRSEVIELLKEHSELDVFLTYYTKDGIATFTTEGANSFIKVNL